MAKQTSTFPFDDVRVLSNPSQQELRDLALKHTPATLTTAYGNINKISRNKARMAQYTYVIADESRADEFSHQVINRATAERLIEAQKAYIQARGEVIAIDGYLGLTGKAFGVQWIYTPEGANIAGMQQVLSFPRSAVESDDQQNGPFEPSFRVVYTPDCFAEDMPGRQAILVDLDNWVTYIMGPDYFGESKKAALRMLNAWVYGKGGLVLHAGAKAVQVSDERLTVTIMGLSGTGKTTTTFSKQGELTHPIQDDMVCLWPGGDMTITENGCFAKTHGLNEESEPVIYRGTLSSEAWVENVYVNEDGTFDFSKSILSPEDVRRYREIFEITGMSVENMDKYIAGEVKADDVVDAHGVPSDGWDFVVWTQNGRSIIPMASIEDAADLSAIPPVRSMGILNRDEGADAATPGLVRFATPAQAAAYFMLGETTKTSAAGKDRGKTRSPFTQPFFPLAHGLQAERFEELAGTMEADTWMMNTGYVGGDARDVEAGKALKVKIRHSSAMLEALLAGTIQWTRDPDFDYEVVDLEHPDNAELLEKVPREILRPVTLYEAQNRRDEYDRWVQEMKAARREFLEKYGVHEDIVKAVG